MSEKTAKAEVTLKPETLEMSLQLQPMIKSALDAKMNGEIDSTVLDANLPAGITVKQAEEFLKFLPTYGAAVTHAYGTVVTPAFAADPELTSSILTAKLPGRNNKIGLNYRRSKESFNPQDRDNPIIAHGHIDFNLDISAGNAKSGEIGRARAMIKSFAATSFSA